MTINISIQDVAQNLHPKITVLGVGGSGGNAVNNMINANLEGVDFLIANTDAQALQISSCPNKIQLGLNSTKGLGAGMRPDIGRQAAEEAIQDLSEKFEGSHMLFIAAGMGGGTGTGAAPVIAKLAREKGILTVGVVTKPFHFEGSQRMKLAEKGIEELQQYVDTLLTIPNQNLFRIANEKTTFSDAFKMADDVLYAGVRGVTDLMVQPGMINLDFSDIKTVMSEMGKAMMGTGEAQGEGRAIAAAEAAIANPLIDDVSLKGAKGLIINITGGKDITLYEVDEAANRVKQEVDEEANIIYGTTCDDRLEGVVRVSIVATGIDANNNITAKPIENFAPINLNNDIYKQDIEKSESLNESIALQEHSIQDGSILDEEIKGISNEQNLNNHNSENIDLDEQTNFNQTETASLEENTDNKVFEQNETSETLDLEQIEADYISDEVSDSSSNIEKPNETSVRRLSLFDTLSTENKSEDFSSENEVQGKTEPVFASSEEKIKENESEDKKTEDNDSSIDEKEEFSAEESETSEIDDEFNQETEEELLDIPTFLRRQAN
ncbi:cell division protein FtsZ [Pelagibacteraceae bacterium]|nr:cell division protein FtsZ [Pelagibacteraceae bacterium]